MNKHSTQLRLGATGFFTFILVGLAFLSRGQQLTLHKDSLRGRSFFIEKFNDHLYSSLKDSTVGWAYGIWKNGKLLYDKQGGYKITPRDTKSKKGIPFQTTTRMHIASLSKTLTALTLARLVELKKIGWDDEVRNYLPSWWKLHPSFEHLNVRALVTMKSGLNGPLDMVSSSADSLQVLMERGPDPGKVGVFNYQNTSYGLLRIVIAYADGFKEPAPDTPIALLAATTGLVYKDAVNKYLFIPAGVDSADCRITEAYPTLQYPFPYDNEPGELTGEPDLTAIAGGFGWYISTLDAGKVLNAVFVRKRILSATSLQELASFGYPVNVRKGKYGSYFGNGGDWGHPIKPSGWRGIHTFFYCYPDDLIVVVFVNSGEGSPARRIMRAYRRSFE
jgi:CubicO group peptidase (beta-lactamase class C family)